jgi:two-component system sensor histidine kinase/response regulator
MEPLNLLLVDDREDSLLALVAVLTSPNYRIVTASSGHEALAQLLRHSDFAVVIMDVQMPGMDGFATATEMKKNEKFKSIPIIFVTAINTDSIYIQKGYEVGAVDYLFKPFDPHILRSKVAVFAELFRQKLLIQTQSAELRDQIQSNSELEKFAYVASHDLQEPLRTVSSFGSLLQKEYSKQLPTEANEYIEFMVEGAKRMQHLIHDLLSYSRAGIPKKDFELTHLQEIVNLAKFNLKATIEESGAHIEVGPLPTISVDRESLVQLFQNILGNAIKFRRDESPKIKISAQEIDGAWKFCVEDNGIGIEPSYCHRIFEIFQRLHTREEYPGSGIGLSICRKIAELHGGEIWVESKPNVGSKFIFTISTKMIRKENAVLRHAS